MSKFKFSAKRRDSDEIVTGYYLVKTGRNHPHPMIFIPLCNFDEDDQYIDVDASTVKPVVSGLREGLGKLARHWRSGDNNAEAKRCADELQSLLDTAH